MVHSIVLLTSFRRDILIALIAIGLLAAPLWAPFVHFGNPTYKYESTEVTATDTGITYANEPDLLYKVQISDEIACAGDFDLRRCSFEYLLTDNKTLPGAAHSNNPHSSPIYDGEYWYVQRNGTLYEPIYITNASVQNEKGMYRVDLGLDRTDPEDALQDVAISEANDEVPAVAVEAAREGHATARHEVDVPTTPIQLEDGTYYRVYLDERSDGAPVNVPDLFLTFVAPFVGLYLLIQLSRRVDITYVGNDRR